jgi:hypothetical protein
VFGAPIHEEITCVVQCIDCGRKVAQRPELAERDKTMSANSILIGANDDSTKTENPGGRRMAKIAQIVCSNPFDRQTCQIPLFPYKQTFLAIGQTLDPAVQSIGCALAGIRNGSH